MKNIKSGYLIFIGISLLIVIFIIFQMVNDKHENPKPKPVEVKKEDINSRLPFTVKVNEETTKPESVASRIWSDFMGNFESEGTIADAFYLRFAKLSEDIDSFVVAAVFEVQLPETTPKVDYGWGEVKDNRMVPNIVWKLTINKVDHLTYTLTNIERTTDTQIGLPPVESLEEYRKNAGIEEPSESIRYEIKGETLRITFNNGEDWKVVPVARGDLYTGESNDMEQQLVGGSYVMTPDITAFVLNQGMRVLVSTDKGESWKESVVSDELPFLRMLKLGFTSKQDGYLIVTGDKTMSSEVHLIFKTNDGGQSWYNVGPVDDTYSLVTDGGFINDQLGFISFGEYRYDDLPPVPNLYRTIDGGANWERVEVPIPEEYLNYFTIAEIPTFHGTEGTLLVNQGEMGDYLGGKVLAKYTTQDQGKTWSFAGLIDPDGVLRPK